MNAFAIGINIKKLREENQITQQQLADSLGISYQAVSKWECGTTIPDVGILPQIAGYFNVSIDELFKMNMTVYQNKAHRLMALYEGDFYNSKFYERAEREFIKLFESENYNIMDVGNYGYLHDLRFKYHLQIAEKYYLKAINMAAKEKDKLYNKYQRQYIYLLSRLGRNKENIERQKKELDLDSNNEENYLSLICAYHYANENKKAYEVTMKGIALFPNSTGLLIYAGDIAEKLGMYDKAVEYWNKSYEINPEQLDTRYSLAFLLTKQGKYEEAIKVWEHIIDWLSGRGFDDSANNWPRSEIKKLKEKLNNNLLK